MNIKKLSLEYLIFLTLFFFIFSCSTTKDIQSTEGKIDESTEISKNENNQESENVLNPIKNKTQNRTPLTLTFCGDLMCHTENAQTKNYADIYKDIESIILKDDFTFANLETPVNNNLPYSTFPSFNVHTEYIMAAITAGIDVFSLANNHTNDWDTEGILQTATFFDDVKNKGVYSAGIHSGKRTQIDKIAEKDKDLVQPELQSDGLTYQIIEKNGWRILFAAYTQILNRNTGLDYIDYYPDTEKSNEDLKKQIIKLKNMYKHDLFILSVHCNEPEYVIAVPEYQKKWYSELRACGVDIIWANHPHVMQEWELYANKNTGNYDSVVMYSLGNLISGQRRPWPNLENPNHKYEYTGDSMLMQMTIEDNPDYAKTPKMEGNTKSFIIKNVNPIYITTHITKWNGDYLIKQLNSQFINSVSQSLKIYYTKRLELIKQIKGKVICQ